VSEFVIRALQSMTDAIVRANRESTVEMLRVMAPLEQLPELARAQGETLVKAVAQQTYSLAEMDVAKLVSDLESLQSMTASLAQLIERTNADFAAETQEVQDRYARLQGELDRHLNERLEAMDAAALQLMEEDVPRVREAYAGGLIPEAQLLEDEAPLFGTLRTEALGEAREELECTLRDLQAGRQQLLTLRASFERSQLLPDGSRVTLPVAVFDMVDGSQATRELHPLPNVAEDAGIWGRLLAGLDPGARESLVAGTRSVAPDAAREFVSAMVLQLLGPDARDETLVTACAELLSARVEVLAHAPARSQA
jgi:hypothetical protein